MIDKLEKIGMKKAVDRVKFLKEQSRKLTLAYEHFRFVRQEKIDEFNEKLKKESLTEDKNAYYYKTLNFIPLESYEEVPPSHIVDKIEEAQKMGCFDTFEIAKIKDVKEVKDPIVFGRVNNCTDRFFIAQWDDDVRIEDILKENEG